VHSLAHRRHDMLRRTSRALVSAAGRATGAPSTGSLSNNSSAACASQWVQNRTIGKVGVPENYGQIDGVGTSFLGTPVNHREVRRGLFVSFIRPNEGKETGTETRPYHVQRKQRDPRCQVEWRADVIPNLGLPKPKRLESRIDGDYLTRRRDSSR
jgi:hypothetical protein